MSNKSTTQVAKESPLMSEIANTEQLRWKLGEAYGEIEHLQAALAQSQRQVAQLQQRYRMLELFFSSLQKRKSSSTLKNHDLLSLIALAHPDKWHGQPATTLAHEILIALNKLREETG